MGYAINPDGTIDYNTPAQAQRPKCPTCKGGGYIWVTETPDTRHDFQMNCPVCNPKIDLYAADRYESDF